MKGQRSVFSRKTTKNSSGVSVTTESKNEINQGISDFDSGTDFTTTGNEL
jgi:hypothetical protein